VINYRHLLFACTLAVSSFAAQAQTWNANAGGYNTGYGTVYGSFGLAMATQNMYQTMQMNMQRATMRQAMVAKWGEAAVAQAERAAQGGEPVATEGAAPDIALPAPPPVRNHGVYQPDPTVDTGSQLASALGSTPEEQQLIGAIYTQTREAYLQEAAAQGWRNNIAGGLTFFTVTALVVYRDIDEPSEEAVDRFYAVMNQSLDALPEVAEVSNADKQAFDNLLIGFAGMLLAGYTEGKQGGDAETLAVYRQLAGELIRLVLKVEPEKLRLENGQITVG
jgi:hypothetical protein